HGLDVLRARRLRLAELTTWKPYPQPVADGVGLDPGEVEDTGKVGDCLANRFAFVASGVQPADRVRDLLRRKGVDPTTAVECAEDQVEGSPDIHACSLGDVDPR